MYNNKFYLLTVQVTRFRTLIQLGRKAVEKGTVLHPRRHCLIYIYIQHILVDKPTCGDPIYK